MGETPKIRQLDRGGVSLLGVDPFSVLIDFSCSSGPCNGNYKIFVTDRGIGTPCSGRECGG